MIDNITRDKIIEAANIVDVVSDFVTLKRAGANYKGLCPFHDDRTPSFMVSPAKNYCKCFACGKGGNPVGFIMEHEQLSYPDALRWLAKKYGITIEERQLTEEEKASQTERESMFIVNEWANKWFQEQLHNTPEGRNVGLSYFRGRGFRDDIIEKFQLGFSPVQRDACTQAALKAGYQEKFLISTPDDQGIAHGVGISIKRDNGTLYDRYAGRVMFPIFTVSGKVVGFGGRVLDAATKGVSVKYQNSPESIIYHKKSELYGLFHAKQAIHKEDCVYMVEGYTDVIAMHQNGVENVVASSGTALTHEQIRLIRRFTNNIVVLYDGDAAGIKASQRGIDMLLGEGMDVKLLLLPDGQDPDEFGRKHTAQEFQAYMRDNQIDFIRFKTDLLMKESQGDPIKMSRLVNNIVQSIAVIPNEITRTFYIREIAQMMQFKEQLIGDAVSKQIKINIEEWKKEKEREERRAQINVQGGAPRPQGEGNTVHTTATGTSYTASEAGDVPPPDFYEYAPDDPHAPKSESEKEGTVGSGTNTSKSKSQAIERLIAQAIIRSGEKIICGVEDEDGGTMQNLSVIEYIYYSLESDGLSFENPLYQHILQKGMQNVQTPGFVAERFFINEPDQEISSLAYDLSSEREQLSRFYERNSSQPSVQEEYNMLMELVSHLISDLKLCIVKRRKDELTKQMLDPNILSDALKYTQIMQQLKEYKDLESKLAKQCGDRVLS